MIDDLGGQEHAIGFLEGCDQALAISAISVAELVAGVRDGAERQQLYGFVEAFEVLPVPNDVAVVAGLWRRQYGRSHGTGLADALIAASVDAVQATLVTLNRRHFPMLADVLVPYAKQSSG